MKWNNETTVSVMTDRIEALKLAHRLIERGIVASVELVYHVTVPNGNVKDAEAIIFSDLEARVKA